MRYCLGLKPAREGAVKFRMLDYLDVPKLPPIPENFGHGALVKQAWGMLGNDTSGDCFFAGGGHETMLWNAEAGKVVKFAPANSLSDYAAYTAMFSPPAFDPATGANDNGTDMQQGAEYRRTVGLIDSAGVRHKPASYLAFDATDPQQLAIATYFFSAAGVGVQLPETADDQFDADQPWTYVAGAAIAGGHYVPCIGRINGIWKVVTWGKTQDVDPLFMQKLADQALAYVSPEMMLNGKDLEGFGLNELQQDLAALG